MNLKACLISIQTVAIFCVIDIFLFGVLSIILHGNAMHGQIRDGHFFVERDGSYHEVTATFYTIILWLGYSLWFAVPTFLLSIFIYGRLRDKLDSASKPKER